MSCRTSPSIASAPSNHEKPVRPVALELLDETVFPVEIGLHRARRDICALVGTAVAVGWIGFWWHLRRPDFQRAVVAALQHTGFKPHLREPGRGHVGAHAAIVGEKDARAADRGGPIDLL